MSDVISSFKVKGIKNCTKNTRRTIIINYMNNRTLSKYALYFINDSSLKENLTVSYCYNQNIKNVRPDKNN